MDLHDFSDSMSNLLLISPTRFPRKKSAANLIYLKNRADLSCSNIVFPLVL